MPVTNPLPDPTPSWGHAATYLPAALATLTEQAAVLQRRILRVDGLSTLEREMRLGTLADMRAVVQQLDGHIAILLEHHAISPTPAPWPPPLTDA